MKLSHTPLLFLAASLMSPALLAEDEARTISFRAAGFGCGRQVLATQPGGETFQISNNFVSNPMEVTLRDQLYLDFYGEKGASDGKPLFSVKVAKGNDEALVIVSPKGDSGLGGMVVNLDALGVRGGGQCVFNMLSVPVMVECGEGAKPVVIRPGAKETISPPSEGKVLQTLYYAGAKNEKIKFSSSLFFKDETAKTIMFCYAEKGAKLPRVMPIEIYDRPKKNG
ncbi:hypothetical protein [Roseibacillus persicicus]|uniref:Uncharacterized protein n=1 Tax=Roseibacillus persicicus TaxID=454148 RepID=A0A918TL84_9BACT|nr:hypothetical protein [Roseibacillus persicicus]GHC51927.1 hypothetical protein GCM10007100_17780 [Roseibacillus persicicus]